jgi:hypothetical protein
MYLAASADKANRLFSKDMNRFQARATPHYPLNKYALLPISLPVE